MIPVGEKVLNALEAAGIEGLAGERENSLIALFTYEGEAYRLVLSREEKARGLFTFPVAKRNSDLPHDVQ